MVKGIESFREWFSGYEGSYTIIGGTACDLLMSDAGLDFRATKDIDLVLIIEAVDATFGKRLWEYIKTAGYENRKKSTGEAQFYRFTKPKSTDYPTMIELFTRKPDTVILPDDAELSPLHIDDDISSLSAILLDNDYYEFLKRGQKLISGIAVLDAPYLIPFKARAWIDLSDRKARGEQVDSKHIHKHKNDVFRLSELLSPATQMQFVTPERIKHDMHFFIEQMESDVIDLRQLGIIGKTKDTVLDELKRIYL